MGLTYNASTFVEDSGSRQTPLSTFAQKKAAKIVNMKDIGFKVVHSQAPAFKQSNLGLYIYTVSEEAVIKQWIKSCKASIDSKEDIINDTADDSALDAIDVSYDILETAAQAHYDAVEEIPMEITKFAFRSRLALMEKLGMDGAAGNEAIGADNQAMALTIQRDFEAAMDIDLSDPALVVALGFYMALTILGSARRITDILNPESVNEVQSVDTVADSSGSLGGKYFLMSCVCTDYYVWFDTGSDSDPEVADRTGIQVSIITDDTAATVATNTKTTLEAIIGTPFQVSIANDDEMTIINSIVGTSKNDVGAGDSGFTVDTDVSSPSS